MPTHKTTFTKIFNGCGYFWPGATVELDRIRREFLDASSRCLLHGMKTALAQHSIPTEDLKVDDPLGAFIEKATDGNLLASDIWICREQGDLSSIVFLCGAPLIRTTGSKIDGNRCGEGGEDSGSDLFLLMNYTQQWGESIPDIYDFDKMRAGTQPGRG